MTTPHPTPLPPLEELREQLIPVSELGKYLPHTPHRNTLHRYTTVGLRGHVLRTVVWAGRRYTTRAWLAVWLAETGTTPGEAQIATEASAQPADDAAGRELAAAGW